MKELKVKHPAMFCGEPHPELAFVYGEEDGIRYNVRAIGSEETEGCAGVLLDWDPEADYSETYEVLDVKTLNPQEI